MKVHSADKQCSDSLHAHQPESNNTRNAVDPVCGMSVDPSAMEFMITYDGEAYYFCSTRCLQTFQSNPATYRDNPERKLLLTAQAMPRAI